MSKRDYHLSMLPAYLLPVLGSIASFSWIMTAWGIVTALALFLAAQYLIRRHSRINRVVAAYLDSHKADAFENGLSRLLKCGVIELKNQGELNEVCRRIEARLKNHPNFYKDVPDKKLLKHLKEARKNGDDLTSATDSLAKAFDKKFPPDED